MFLGHMSAELLKIAAVATTLQPHQQRVVDKIQKQPGLVVAHGLGSGKTLTAIASQDALGVPATVVLPAALQANYAKEQKKHLTGEGQDATTTTTQALARRNAPLTTPMLIVDEAHKAREAGTATQSALRKIEADKRLLMTASPFYNRPSDIAPLVNIAAGEDVLPQTQQLFDQKYVKERSVSPGLFRRMLGVEPGVRRELNKGKETELRDILDKWVDYHENSQEGFPSVTRETVEVPMTRKQTKAYDALLGNAPAWVSYKIRKGLPTSKAESSDLNAFSAAARQVSLSTAAHLPDAELQSPKIDEAVRRFQEALQKNPAHKAVVYSNYVDAGLAPYRAQLQKAGIPFGEFTGAMDKKQRDQMVRDYNEDKIKALLLSSAGGEGLDLKGTRTIQMLEPHWNNEKLRQVEGRGIRYLSHAALPEDQRSVNIESYLATRPSMGLMERIGLSRPGGSVDQYMAQHAAGKDELIESFRALLKPKKEKTG